MPDQLEILLWPTGQPTGAQAIPANQIEELKNKQTNEHLTLVNQPALTFYPAPQEKANGCCVVVCPGGGYNILAWPKEGLELAEWFNSLGITAVVLKYRVPRRNPEKPHWEPLQDGQRAMRLVRQNASQWNIDPNRIGLLGFSAGGHLALMVATQHHMNSYSSIDCADTLSSRPDFLCPIYAAYLGPNYRDDIAELGDLIKIESDMPPTFMAVTLDDDYRGVQAGLLMSEFKRVNVTAEAHIYAVGGHGYGIRPSNNPVSTWHWRLKEWMQAQGFLQAPTD